jgi:hypothetical protein
MSTKRQGQMKMRNEDRTYIAATSECYLLTLSSAPNTVAVFRELVIAYAIDDKSRNGAEIVFIFPVGVSSGINTEGYFVLQPDGSVWADDGHAYDNEAQWLEAQQRAQANAATKPPA